MLKLLRILLKIVLFPIILVLSFVAEVLRLLTIISGTIINTLSMLAVVIITIQVIAGMIHWKYSIIGYVTCFVFSEFGIFAIANLILDGVDGFTMKLKEI